MRSLPAVRLAAVALFHHQTGTQRPAQLRRIGLLVSGSPNGFSRQLQVPHIGPQLFPQQLQR